MCDMSKVCKVLTLVVGMGIGPHMLVFRHTVAKLRLIPDREHHSTYLKAAPAHRLTNTTIIHSLQIDSCQDLRSPSYLIVFALVTAIEPVGLGSCTPSRLFTATVNGLHCHRHKTFSALTRLPTTTRYPASVSFTLGRLLDLHYSK